MPADADARALRPVNHDRGVPPDVRADPALGLLVAGEPWLSVRPDRVDVVRAAQAWQSDSALARSLHQAQHHVAGAIGTVVVDELIERIAPLAGLVGVDVHQLGGQAGVDERLVGMSGSHGEPRVSQALGGRRGARGGCSAPRSKLPPCAGRMRRRERSVGPMYLHGALAFGGLPTQRPSV